MKQSNGTGNILGKVLGSVLGRGVGRGRIGRVSQVLATLALVVVLPLSAAARGFDDNGNNGNANNGTHGGPRSGGYPVKVVVTAAGSPAAGVTVTVTCKHSATATTDASGVATFQLAPCSYKVTATGAGGTGEATAKVVKSTTPLLVPVTLSGAAQ